MINCIFQWGRTLSNHYINLLIIAQQASRCLFVFDFTQVKNHLVLLIATLLAKTYLMCLLELRCYHGHHVVYMFCGILSGRQCVCICLYKLFIHLQGLVILNGWCLLVMYCLLVAMHVLLLLCMCCCQFGALILMRRED